MTLNSDTELIKKNILRQNNEEANSITRECIETALIELMKVSSFNNISITDITRKAGVSRNAYYRNYSSKEDILSKYLQNIESQISSILLNYNPLTETKESWIALLNSAKSFAPQFKLLLDAGYGEKIKLEIQNGMNLKVPKENYALYYSNCYWAGAIYSVLFEWIVNDMNVPINELADIGSNLMINGLNTIFIYGNNCS